MSTVVLVQSARLAEPVVLPRTATLAGVARAMGEHAVSAVLLGDPDRPEAIVTERDVVTAAAQELPGAVPARVLGSADPWVVDPRAPLADAVGEMLGRGIRHLPVVGHDGRVEGVLALTAALERMIDTGHLPAWSEALRQALHVEQSPWRRGERSWRHQLGSERSRRHQMEGRMEGTS